MQFFIKMRQNAIYCAIQCSGSFDFYAKRHVVSIILKVILLWFELTMPSLTSISHVGPP